MGNILEEVSEAFDAHREAPKTSQHYQLTGSKSERINESARTLSQVFVSHEVKFDETDLVFNVITKIVIPAKFRKGEYRIVEIIEERIVGFTSLSGTIKKKKVTNLCKQYKNCLKIVTMKIKSEPVIIKADRKQMPQSLFLNHFSQGKTRFLHAKTTPKFMQKS